MKPTRFMLLTAVAACPASAFAQPFSISSYTTPCGGTTTPVAAGPYTLVCTIGDPLAAPAGSAGTFSLGTGFIVISTGGAPPCYPNCDGSSGSPLLTANDFLCFINAYAAASPAANCDASTGTPTLTANDFLCFINAFAAGCS